MKSKLVQRVISRKYVSFPHSTPHSSFLYLLPDDFNAYILSLWFYLLIIQHPIIALVGSVFPVT